MIIWMSCKVKFRVFWDVAPCSHVEVHRRFRGACCLHQGDGAGRTHLWNVGLFNETLRRYIPEDYRLHNCLKSHRAINCFHGAAKLNSHWLNQEIIRLLWNHKLHCLVYKRSLLIVIVIHINLLNAFPSYLHLDLKWSVLLRISDQNLYSFLMFYTRQCPTHVIAFDFIILIIIIEEYKSCRSRVSSGSIVSDYGLDDRAIGVRSPEGAKDFSSSLCVQTGYGAHPACCPMGTGGPFPGVEERPGRDADHSPPTSAEVVNE
jgi:hypothetical protein